MNQIDWVIYTFSLVKLPWQSQYINIQCMFSLILSLRLNLFLYLRSQHMQVENNDLSHQALWKLEKVTVYIIESVEYVCSLTMRYQSVIQVVGTLHLHTGYDFVIQVIVEGSIETSLIKRPQLQFRKILGSVTCHKIEWITYSIP